ncbi:MAG: hypothetical protein LBL86_01175 [Coriobacteriales bacterium]|jgi:hypothetical protein|nr:hypothetical protein [Coriobacteriales bacterium]
MRADDKGPTVRGEEMRRARRTRQVALCLLAAVAVSVLVLRMQAVPGASVEPTDAPVGGTARSSSGSHAGDAVRGRGEGEGEALDEDRLFSRPPPFALPASLRPRGYEKGTYVETWRAVSDGSCREVARELLLRLRESGMELVEADYLDLFGEAWGCVLRDHGEASLSITLVPERLLRERDGSNPLRMTLVRTAASQQPSVDHPNEFAEEQEDGHGK